MAELIRQRSSGATPELLLCALVLAFSVTVCLPAALSASGEEVGTALNTFDVPPGATVTLTFQVTVDSPLNTCATAVSNQGTFTGSNFAPVLTDDPATGAPADPTVTPLDVADLAVTKTNGTTTSTPGDPTTYTLTVTNNGPAAVTGATVADTFPAALTGVTWTCGGTGGATCTAAGTGDISDLVSIPAGESVTYSATGTIDPGATGSLANTATVTAPATTTDCNLANNTATDTDTLTAEADLAITKDDGQASAVPGEAVTYTITVTNAGPSDAVGATVADTFPGILSGVTWTCVPSAGASCTASGSGDISDTVTIPAGGNVTYSATGTIDPGATGTLDNTATVTAPGGIDPNTSDNSATDSDTLTPTADLSITKDDGVTTVVAGGSTTYTITAANAGPTDVTGATVADFFPPELTCTWTCAGAGGGTCTAAGSGDVNDTVALPVGGSVTYTATCAIDGAASGSLANTATVSVPSGVTDPDGTNDSATDTDTVQQLDFGDAPDPTYPTLLASNGARHVLGGGPLLGSAIDSEADGQPSAGADGDDLSGLDDEDGVTFTSPLRVGQNATVDVEATVAGLLNAWVDFNGDGDWADAGEQVFTDQALAAGTNGLAFTVPAGAPVPLSTFSRFRVSSAGGDLPTGLAADGEVEDYTVAIEPVADLSVTKTDDADPPAPGANLTYTITVDNLGPSAATGVEVTDTLPAGVTLVATSGCAEDPAGVPTCTLGAIAASGSAAYTIEVSIDPGTSGQLSNTATATGSEFDPDSTNSSDTETTNLLVADLGITKDDGQTTAVPGEAITYTIVVTNAGPTDAAGATVTDSFPASSTGVTWTCVASAGSSCTASGSGDLAETVTVLAGGTLTYTVDATVDAGATGTLANTATVTPPADTSDPDTTDNSATDTDTLAPSADLAITKTDDADPPPAGANLTYTITVDNLGPSDATGVVVTDTLPASVTLVATSGCAEDPTGVPTCTLGAIAAGGSASYTIEVSIDAPPPASLSNTAAVAGNEPDPNAGNDSATEDTSLDADAPFVVEVVAVPGGPVSPGQVFTSAVSELAVTFSEEVFDPAGDADPDDVTNPANYLLVEAGPNDVVDTAGCGAGAAGDDVAIPLTGILYDPILSTVTLVLSQDLGPGTYRLFVCGSTSIVDLAGNPLGGGEDFTLTFRVASLLEIPTLATWGRVLLIALLAGLALSTIRRGGLLVLVALVLAAPRAATAQILIDDFTTSQATLADPPPPPSSSSVTGGGILGGTRDLVVELVSGTATVAQVFGVPAPGVLRWDSGTPTGSTARLVATWDGDLDPLDLDATGLSPLDLTAGGTLNTFRLRAGTAFDNPADAVIEVFTNGSNSSKAALRIPLSTPQDHFLTFSEFVPVQGAGADFTDVGAITLTLSGTSTNVTVEIFEIVPPALAATKTDALTGDVDSDTQADPGDTLTYTITITNPGGEAIAVDLSDMVDANTTLVAGSVSSTPIAKNDQYTAIGNVVLEVDGTPLAGVLANDGDPDGDPITVTAIDPFSVRGGPVLLDDAATGAFRYTPPAGFNGVDTFTYTVEDDDGNAAIGQVTVLVDGTVWFVDNTNTCGVPPCGVGTQADPFHTMVQAEAASQAGDIVRIRQGDGTAAGQDQGFVLKAGQRLVGGAADLVIDGNLVEAGAGPAGHSVHTHAGGGNVLDLAGDHIIEGMRLNPTASHGVAGTGSSNVTLDNVVIYTANTAGGISLTNHGGSFTFANSMITSTVGTTGVAVTIAGGSGFFDFSGSGIAHDGGGLIHVQNTNAATVNFTGSNPTLANGTNHHGILLDNNTGGSFTFDSIGDVATGGGDAVRIANSATVNLGTVGNVSSTAGAALDVSGSTVAKHGAPGPITFASLASTGGTVGVNLNGVVPAVTVNGATTVNGAAGVNLQGSGPVTFTGQLGATSTAGAALTAANTGLVSVLDNTSTVNATGGPGLDVTNTALGMTFASLSAAPGGGGRGVSLVGASGTVTANGGSITGGTAGTAFHVDGGSAAVTYGGTVTQNNAQRAVDIEDTTGGAVNLNAKVTGGQSSTGVRIHNADGNASFADLDLGTSGARMAATALTLSGGSAGTFAFADTQIFTNNATGLDANNGGTIEVTGGGNRVDTTNGVAINMLGGTTIGSNGVTFQRVDASNAARGIRLDGTGAGGSFSVTGDGATAGSGGTIQDAGSTMINGIQLDNAHNVSLAFMNLTNANRIDGGAAGVCDGNVNTGCNAAINLNGVTNVALDNINLNGAAEMGINGRNVTNFDLSNSMIQNAGNATDEHGLHIRELFGTQAAGNHSTIINTTITNSNNHNAFIVNSTATSASPTTPDLLVVSGSTFSSLAAPNGANGLLHESRTAGNMRLEVSSSIFSDNRGVGINHQSAQGGRNHLSVTSSTFTSSTITAGAPEPFQDVGVSIGATQTGVVTFDVSGNTQFRSRNSHHVNITAFDTASITGTVASNTNMNGSANGSGVRAVFNGGSTGMLTISGNVMGGFEFGRGIDLQSREGAGSLDVTLSGNNVNSTFGPGTFANHGVFVASGNGTSGESNRICVHYENNTSTGGLGRDGYRVEQFSGTTFQIQDLAPASGATSGQIVTHIQGQNTAGSASVTPADPFAGTVVNYTANNCATP